MDILAPIDTEREYCTTGESPQEGESLPCLYSNNSIETSRIPPDFRSNRLSTSQKKSAIALASNVQYMASRHGLERLGFLTLTFPKKVTNMADAQRHFNSLATNYLRDRFPHYISVKERHKNGSIHFHLLVVCKMDIRTDFPWASLDTHDYSGVPSSLRSLWTDLRHNLKKYGFGRHELLPVKSTAEGIGRYVGKYISKNVQCRPDEDKGTRLVNYAGDTKNHSTQFTPLTEGSRQWRHKTKQFVRDLNQFRRGEIPINFRTISEVLGKRWAYNYREIILSYPDIPPTTEINHENSGQNVSLPLFGENSGSSGNALSRWDNHQQESCGCTGETARTRPQNGIQHPNRPDP